MRKLCQMLNSLILMLFCGVICLRHKLLKQNVYGKAIVLIWPSTVVVAGVLLRIAIGGMLIWLFRDMQLKDEFRLYEVSLTFLDQKMFAWTLLVGAAVASYYSASLIIEKTTRVLSVQKEINQSDADRSMAYKSLVLLVGVLAGFGIINSVQGVVLGTHDRGHEYLEWISGAWERPDSWIQAVIKLKYLYFILLPFVFKVCNRNARLAIALPAGIMCGLALLTGARGDVLYPLAFTLVGVLLTRGLTWKRLAVVGVTGMIVVGLGAPILEGIRDTEGFQKTKVRNLDKRIGGIVLAYKEISEGARVRAPQIGRQLYACSDGYLFERGGGEAGWNDIGKTLLGAFPPLRSIIGISKGVEFQSSFDGSVIAQKSMGTKIPGWYPCITLVGDSFRRGGYIGVCMAGLALGVTMLIIDGIWLRLVSRSSSSLRALVIGVLPVLYMQTFPLGTISETVWWLSWDSLKYSIICLALVAGCEMIARIWKDVNTP